MPRSKSNPNEFVAGCLPTVKIGSKSFYVDGRLQQLRDITDFNNSINSIEDHVYESLSQVDKAIILFEFTGESVDSLTETELNNCINESLDYAQAEGTLSDIAQAYDALNGTIEQKREYVQERTVL